MYAYNLNLFKIISLPEGKRVLNDTGKESELTKKLKPNPSVRCSKEQLAKLCFLSAKFSCDTRHMMSDAIDSNQGECIIPVLNNDELKDIQFLLNHLSFQQDKLTSLVTLPERLKFLRIASEHDITIKNPLVAVAFNTCIKDFLNVVKLMPKTSMQRPINDLRYLLKHSDFSIFVIEQLFSFEFKLDDVKLFFKLFGNHLNLDHLKGLDISCNADSFVLGLLTLYELIQNSNDSVVDIPNYLRVFYKAFASLGFEGSLSENIAKKALLAFSKKHIINSTACFTSWDDESGLLIMASNLASFNLTEDEKRRVVKNAVICLKPNPFGDVDLANHSENCSDSLIELMSSSVFGFSFKGPKTPSLTVQTFNITAGELIPQGAASNRAEVSKVRLFMRSETHGNNINELYSDINNFPVRELRFPLETLTSLKLSICDKDLLQNREVVSKVEKFLIRYWTFNEKNGHRYFNDDFKNNSTFIKVLELFNMSDSFKTTLSELLNKHAFALRRFYSRYTFEAIETLIYLGITSQEKKAILTHLNTFPTRYGPNLCLKKDFRKGLKHDFGIDLIMMVMKAPVID